MPNPTTLSLLFFPFAYLLICATIAAIAAFPLHYVFGDLIGFHTLVSRGTETILVAGLFPLSRYLGITRLDMGLGYGSRLFWRRLGIGFAAGLLMLGIHLAVLLALDARVPRPQGLEWVRFIRLSAKGLAVGAAVACIEEPIFRGFLFGALRRHTTLINAILISSFWFAMLHFLDSGLRLKESEIQWNSGFTLLADAFSQLPVQIRLDSFLALFAAGVLLACLRSLFAPGLGIAIGMHMGWVTIIKSAKPFTKVGNHPTIAGMVSQFDGFMGYFSAVWTTLLVVLLIHRYRVHFWSRP